MNATDTLTTADVQRYIAQVLRNQAFNDRGQGEYRYVILAEQLEGFADVLDRAADDGSTICLFTDPQDRELINTGLRALQDPRIAEEYAAFQSIHTLERIRDIGESLRSL